MIEPTVTCPSCSTEIKLTESLAAPLVQATRREYEVKIAEKEIAFGERENSIRVRQKEIEDAQNAIDAQVAETLKSERAAIAAAEQKKAKLAVAEDLDAKARELTDLQQQLTDRNEKLKAAQKEQADLMRQKRELDDQKRELDLTIETRVQASIEDVRQKAKTEAENGLKLKVAEKEEQINSMQRQIEDLKKKAEQGSQQLQGEALELALESALRGRFPSDSIEPVGKGEYGGDIIHRVIGPIGQECGTILWETKRTRNWSDGWLSKLRGDQRAAKAEIAILISNALPRGVDAFDHVDGVWVAETRFAIPLVIALRQSLIELAGARQARDGQETKMELVYGYLTGPKFRHRVEAIVEKFSEMKADLDRERKTMTRLWAKREMQIYGVIESTVGMYGDLQGIAGRALKEIEGLEMPLIEGSIESPGEGDA